MKKIALSLLFTATLTGLCAQEWEPAGDRVKTVWAETIDPQRVLPEYPRPDLTRDEWQNLNGLWRCASAAADAPQPERFDGEILVPFVPASSLSGLQRRISDGEAFWYERSFTLPASWSGRQVLLHFGAADGLQQLWVNGVAVDARAALDFDITALLLASGEQRLVVKCSGAAGVAAGIAQTVWLEPVAKRHLTRVEIASDLAQRRFVATASGEELTPDDVLEFRLYDAGRLCASGRTRVGQPLVLTPKSPALWTPEQPVLYAVEVCLISRRRVLDRVGSYCALREVGVRSAEADRMQFQLNGTDYFALGVFDARWWPDGLYTAPSDAAMVADIELAKRLGFNLIKYAGTASARWFYHCARLGMLVWTDAEGLCPEFGGIALPLHAHIWNPEKNWGYVKYRTSDEVTAGYRQQVEALKPGVGAVVFRQLTDFEGDVTGLQTADRKALKVDEEQLVAINRELRVGRGSNKLKIEKQDEKN